MSDYENGYTVGDPMPKTIGRCADLYHEVRELRLAMDKEVAKVKKRETEIREYIIDNLSASDDTGAAGLKYRAQITTKERPTVTDWDEVWDYIFEHDRVDFVQKRLSDKAITDMWANGERVPGIDKMTVKDVSITKIK